MLRWWFTLNYDSIQTSQDRLAFEVRGQGVKVESENEHLTAQGERIHPGDSEPLNRQFVESFTKHFDELCAKYPIYAELRNICDLALAASLVREERLADKVGWHMAYFGDPQAFAVQQRPAAKEVDSVVNYRVLSSRVFVVQVSGGVEIKPAELVSRKAIQAESYPNLQGKRPQQRRQAPGRPLVVGLSDMYPAHSVCRCSIPAHGMCRIHSPVLRYLGNAHARRLLLRSPSGLGP